MYFNLDNQRKQNILKYYQKEANDYRRKKEEEKKQRIQEELNYIHQKEQNQHESDEKISEENYKKKKAIMDEYLEMLQKTKNYLPGYHFSPEKKEVIINNWGKSKEEYLRENNNNNLYSRNKLFESNSLKNFNSYNRGKLNIKPIDTMNTYLTDDINDNEINSFLLRQKQNKKNYYKDLLFSQHIDSARKNKNIFGTEDFLVLNERKKKLITENPYRKKNEYGFGDSILESNPIVNPENNIRYNKYLKDFYPNMSSDKNEIDNNSNINKINNKININNYNKDNNIYKNNYNNQKSENNLVINGSNIMNNYNIDISKLKSNNDNLYRNFKDI